MEVAEVAGRAADLQVMAKGKKGSVVVMLGTQVWSNQAKEIKRMICSRTI